MNISRKYERKIRILSRNSCKYENEIFFHQSETYFDKIGKNKFLSFPSFVLNIPPVLLSSRIGSDPFLVLDIEYGSSVGADNSEDWGVDVDVGASGAESLERGVLELLFTFTSEADERQRSGKSLSKLVELFCWDVAFFCETLAKRKSPRLRLSVGLPSPGSNLASFWRLGILRVWKIRTKIIFTITYFPLYFNPSPNSLQVHGPGLCPGLNILQETEIIMNQKL